jgi:hypothetical protein
MGSQPCGVSVNGFHFVLGSLSPGKEQKGGGIFFQGTGKPVQRSFAVFVSAQSVKNQRMVETAISAFRNQGKNPGVQGFGYLQIAVFDPGVSRCSQSHHIVRVPAKYAFKIPGRFLETSGFKSYTSKVVF